MSFGNITPIARDPRLTRTGRDRWAKHTGLVVEGRSRRVICLVAGIWLFNAFDLALTIIAHQQGLLQEENPLARELLRHGAVPLILYKTGLVLIGSYPLLKFRAARITELGTLVVLLIYALLAARWSSCYDVYHATFAQAVSQPENRSPRSAACRAVVHPGTRRYRTERTEVSEQGPTMPTSHRTRTPELEDTVTAVSPHGLMSDQ